MAEQDENGIRRCGAKKRGKPGQFCQSRVVMANGRCRIHGGTSLTGPAHPKWNGGAAYFKHLPKELANGYKAIADDVDLTELREDLRLQLAMIDAALVKMSETEAPPWGKAVELLNDCKTAKSKEKFDKAFAELEQVIRTGKNAVAAYERLEGKIRELLQERTKTASAEWKRRADMQTLVELEKVQWFGRAVFAAIAEETPDVEHRRRIFKKVLAYMPKPDAAIIEGKPLAIEEQDELQ